MLASSLRKPQRMSLLLPLLLCACLPSAARAERLPIKTYTVADGLPRDNVYRIRRDARGFLWFCTAEGLARFDGLRMTNFTVADGLPNRRVEDVLETENGTIYIATGKGLARLNPHGLRGSADKPLFTVLRPDNPKAEYIQTLYEDKNNQVWVGTSDGLYKLTERDGHTVLAAVPLGQPLHETIYINEILADRRGALWIGTGADGLLRLSANGDVRRFTTEDGFANNIVEALLEDRTGQIWVGFRNNGGLCLLDGEAGIVKKCYAQKDGLPSGWIPDLLQTSDGQIWAATVAGLCLWQGEGAGSVCKTYTEKNDLCDGVIALAEDKDGNLWTGSTCGAKKIARYGFTAYYEADGLGWEKTNSIFENSQGELFVSANRTARVVSRFDGDKFSLVKPLVPAYVDWYGWGWQQTVWQDSRGAWWIPTGYGLFRSPDHTSFDTLARAPLASVETGLKLAPPEAQKRSLMQKYGAAKVAGMKFYEIFRLFEDSRGDVWLAVANEKLLRWERAANRWHDYTPQAGLSNVRLVSAFAEDRAGNIWIGTGSDDAREINEGLLLRYRNGQLHRFTHADGAPTGWIRDLFLDARGRLWLASTNDGVRRIDDTNADVLKFISYTPANGLTSLSTASLTEDEFGRIYIGTWRGIDRLTPDTGQVENFTAADGLPGGYVESSYRDRKNNLWFVTDNGLARFVPEPVRQRKLPVILLTGVRVGGEAQRVSILGETDISGLELDSTQRQISVDFLGVGATLGEKLKYEYRFGHAAWTPTDERTVNFANLTPGTYRFEVRAVTADRLSSPAPATLTFRIATPIWQRAWFLAALVLATGLGVYALYRYRIARLLEVANMRTRIATDLHDDIGADLTKIALLSEVARRQMGASAAGPDSPLPSIARISREAVATMSDIVWAINPRRDSLRDLVSRMRQHAEEVFTLRGIGLSFNAPEDGQHLRLDVDVRRDLFLIFKEAVNNAARHSRCTGVAIDFWAEGASLCLRVSDDGVGFDPAAESEGHGLMSMRRRAEGLGGELEVEASGGAGTTIIFKLHHARPRRPWLRHTYPV